MVLSFSPFLLRCLSVRPDLFDRYAGYIFLSEDYSMRLVGAHRNLALLIRTGSARGGASADHGSDRGASRGSGREAEVTVAERDPEPAITAPG